MMKKLPIKMQPKPDFLTIKNALHEKKTDKNVLYTFMLYDLLSSFFHNQPAYNILLEKN